MQHSKLQYFTVRQKKKKKKNTTFLHLVYAALSGAQAKDHSLAVLSRMAPEASSKALHTSSVIICNILLVLTKYSTVYSFCPCAKVGLSDAPHEEATQEVLKTDQEKLNVNKKEYRSSRITLAV